MLRRVLYVVTERLRDLLPTERVILCRAAVASPHSFSDSPRSAAAAAVAVVAAAAAAAQQGAQPTKPQPPPPPQPTAQFMFGVGDDELSTAATIAAAAMSRKSEKSESQNQRASRQTSKQIHFLGGATRRLHALHSTSSIVDALEWDFGRIVDESSGEEQNGGGGNGEYDENVSDDEVELAILAYNEHEHAESTRTLAASRVGRLPERLAQLCNSSSREAQLQQLVPFKGVCARATSIRMPKYSHVITIILRALHTASTLHLSCCTRPYAKTLALPLQLCAVDWRASARDC